MMKKKQQTFKKNLSLALLTFKYFKDLFILILLILCVCFATSKSVNCMSTMPTGTSKEAVVP